MVREVAQALRAERGGWFVDCTLGLGGHSRALLESSPDTRVLGVDRDGSALSLARESLAPFGDRFLGVHANFKDVSAWSAHLPEAPAGILADLGMSTFQLKAGRGFSFADAGALDMRMDPSAGHSAAEFLNSAPEEDVARIFKEYGEEPFARRIAHSIVERRPVEDASTLAAIVEHAVPNRFHGRVHPATRVFQALRIYVNGELEGLGEFVTEAFALLVRGGRMAVLAYHSLEDRIVKNRLRDAAKGCTCPPEIPVCVCGGHPRVRVLTRRPVVPGEDEIRANPRARSARLRAAERLPEAA
jgi:16S rRNA (cytosine1402-N4)-methyltransferase